MKDADGEGNGQWGCYYTFQLPDTGDADCIISGYTRGYLYVTYSLQSDEAYKGSIWMSKTGGGGATQTLDYYDSVAVGAAEEKYIRRYELTQAILDDLTDGSGNVYVYFDVRTSAATPSVLKVYYLKLELTASSDGLSIATAIQDTTAPAVSGASRIRVAADITMPDGYGIWEGCPYSIVDVISNHVAGLVTDHDGMMTMTANTVESTSNISTRHFKDRTPLEVLSMLAAADAAVFWVPIGTKDLTWKSTFNDATTALDDSDVLYWKVSHDYDSMFNEHHVYGVRVNDEQLYRDSSDLATDPGADSKTLYGFTRAAAATSHGTLTQYETDALADILVDRDENMRMYIDAVLPSLNTTYKLGTQVALSSSLLDLASINYVVTWWKYDSSTYKTTIRMQPRGNVGYIDRPLFTDTLKRQQDAIDSLKIDTTSLAPSEDTY